MMIVENLPVPFDRRVWSEALALRAAGLDVTVICPGVERGLAREEVLEGIRILRHPLKEAQKGVGQYVREYAQALYWETRLAWKVWRSHRFQAIHICNPPDLLFLVAWPFKVLFGASIIFDHHDLSPELYEVKFQRRGLGYWLLRAAEFLTFRVANKVISTNESYARIARERGGVRAEDVTIVRSGPDLQRFKRPDGEPRSEHAGVTIGYIGVIAEQDGVDLLISAMHSIVAGSGRKDIRLLVIGDGPSRPELEQQVEALGLSDNVTFTGFQSGDSLLELLGTVDIGVCPDPYNAYNDKCTMNKILEYMAMGIPVVQFDLKEGRVSAGDAALYAGKDNDPKELAAAILELADDQVARRELGERGRMRMERVLEWRHQIPKLLSVYGVGDQPR